MIINYAQPNQDLNNFLTGINTPAAPVVPKPAPDVYNPFAQDSFINKPNYLGPNANSTPMFPNTATPVQGTLPQYTAPVTAPGTVASIAPKAPVDTFNYNANSPQTRTIPSNFMVGGTVLNPTTTTTPVPGSANAAAVQAGMYQSGLTPEQQALQTTLLADQKATATQVLSPEQEYQNQLKSYQAQIDSINAMYADRLNQARIQGQGRIESRQFAQGRSGQIGSGVGEAGVNAVQDANTEVANSIRAEQKNAIDNVYAKVKSGADASLAAKTLAKQAGADKLLEYLNNVPGEKKKATSSAVAELLARGVDVKNMTPEEIKSYTSGLGISEEQLSSEFATQSKILEADKAKKATADLKAKADLEKTQADTAKTNFDITNWGKMTDYQKSQLSIERYKAQNPTGTASEKKANAMGKIAAEIKPGTTLADGTPVLDASGQYFTASGLKYMINNAPQLGLTKEEVIEQFGQFVYNDPKTGIPDSYGLTPADKKIINGELK